MNPFPYFVIPSAREILANTDRLPDGELIRIAGELRVLADEVMGVVDRRLGGRPKPQLVVDNTRQGPPVWPEPPHSAGHDRTG